MKTLLYALGPMLFDSLGVLVFAMLLVAGAGIVAATTAGTVVALGVVGVAGQGQDAGRMHGFVALLGVVGFINVLGEELGWRGFLQDQTRSIARVGRYLLIGTLWTVWHFTNLFAHRDGAELWTYLAWYFPVTVVLSAVIGECTERTRSLAVAVTLHAWMNIAIEFGDVRVWAVLAGSVVFWAWMLWRWPVRGPTGLGGVPRALSSHLHRHNMHYAQYSIAP